VVETTGQPAGGTVRVQAQAPVADGTACGGVMPLYVALARE
jgi:hypothetical protein